MPEYKDSHFPYDGSLVRAKNYCRYVDNGNILTEGPYCHVYEDINWEYCDVCARKYTHSAYTSVHTSYKLCERGAWNRLTLVTG